MPGDDQEALLDALVSPSVESPVLTSRERALLAYADRLTQTPSSVTLVDVEWLREVGLEDRAIHDACAIVAYYAFVNRIADGLGIELEEPA